jgi:hypothetical protein
MDRTGITIVISACSWEEFRMRLTLIVLLLPLLLAGCL